MTSQPSAALVDGPGAAAEKTAAEPANTQVSAAGVRFILNRAKTSSAGTLGLAAVATGTLLAIGGTIWAIEADVPSSIAIMAGYCTLASSVCLAAALVFLLAPAETTEPVQPRPGATSVAWKYVQKFSVSNASRLWCDIEPGSTVTQESIAWARVLLDAISRGELPMIEKTGVRKELIESERNNPNWHTEVTRDALRAWAEAHGFNPRFLQD